MPDPNHIADQDAWDDLAETISYLARLVTRIRRMRDGGDTEPDEWPDDLKTAIMPAEAVLDSVDERSKRKRLGTRGG